MNISRAAWGAVANGRYWEGPKRLLRPEHSMQCWQIRDSRNPYGVHRDCLVITESRWPHPSYRSPRFCIKGCVYWKEWLWVSWLHYCWFVATSVSGLTIQSFQCSGQKMNFSVVPAMCNHHGLSPCDHNYIEVSIRKIRVDGNLLFAI